MEKSRRYFLKKIAASTAGLTFAGMELQAQGFQLITQKQPLLSPEGNVLQSQYEGSPLKTEKPSLSSSSAGKVAADKNLLDPILNEAVKEGANEKCHPWAPRNSLQPVCRMESDANGVMLWLESNSNVGCYGGWEIVCTDFFPGKEYLFQATAQINGIPHPGENISPEVYFFSGEASHPLDWRFLEAKSQTDSNIFFNHSITVPQEADRVVIRLLLRWTSFGSVQFSDVALTETKKIAPPSVTFAVGAGWKSRKAIQGNLDKCLEVIRTAAQKGADFILLPELILTWGVPGDYWDLARSIPGKETDQIAACAQSNYIGVGLTMQEANGDIVHNTGLVFDKQGKIVSKYRKVHLSVGERWNGVTPGNQYPFVDFPFGRVGMQICYDNVHPEGLKILSNQGVGIVLLPIMGDPRASVNSKKTGKWEWKPELWDLIMRMRALDNHVWYVIARNNGEGSCIVNPAGKIIASMKPDEEILFAEVDTSFRNPSSIGSNFYNRYRGERRPSTYSKLFNQ